MTAQYNGNDAVLTFLDLPQTVLYEDMQFYLAVDILESGLRIGYKLNGISLTSKHYNGDMFATEWNNPRYEKPTAYLYHIQHIRNASELRINSISLRQFLIENDIIEGEKWP